MLTRRQSLRGLAGLTYAAAARHARAANENVAYGRNTIPAGIRSRFLDNINGLRIHCLEAGFEAANRPCLLLLHGFPELAYSWRRVMLPLAAAGYHVIAPDQRGFGRTTGWDNRYDTEIWLARESAAPFQLTRTPSGSNARATSHDVTAPAPVMATASLMRGRARARRWCPQSRRSSRRRPRPPARAPSP